MKMQINKHGTSPSGPDEVQNGAKELNSVSLDDAMAHTGIGLYNILHMILSGIILMGVIMQSLVLGYVMPAAQCDLQLTLEQKGWLGAIPFIAIILTSHTWGYLADTRGRRPVMQYSMLLSIILSVITSFSPSLKVLAVFQFLSSIFMSGTSAVVYAYLGEFNSPRHRDKMVAFGASFVGIGTVLLPGLAWLILPLDISYHIPYLDITYRSWRVLMIACTTPYLLSTVLLIIAPESPKFLIATGQQDACLVVVRKIYAINKRMPENKFPVKSIALEYRNSSCDVDALKGRPAMLVSMWEQTVPLFKMPLLPWTSLACFVQLGIFASANGFYVWFPTILNSLASHAEATMKICDVLDSEKWSAPNTTQLVCDNSINTDTFERSIYVGLLFCSMYIVVGFLVDVLGKKLILVSVLSGAGVCGIVSNLVHNQQVGVALFAVFQMCGACIGLMNAVTVQLFPTKYRAMAVCLSMMMGRVGSVLGSNLIGLFLAVYCGASFYLFGGLLIVCALICLTLPENTKPWRKKTVEEPEQMNDEPCNKT